MNPLKKAVDSWFGRGEASITIPPMDGAFRPNDLLDLASSNLEAPAPDCLAVTSHGVIVSSDLSLLRADKPGGEAIASFDMAISALTGLPDGGAAVGLIDGRIVFVGGERGGTTLAKNPGVACITALAPASDGALLVANGSATNGPAAWKRDLMEKNASGSVWRIDRQGARLMPCRRSGLPLRPPRRRRLNRGLGKLALRADEDFFMAPTVAKSRCWRTFPPIRAACLGPTTRLSGSRCLRRAASLSNSSSAKTVTEAA